MDIGSGVALGTLGLSAAIVIVKYGPSKNNKCTLHQGIVERLQSGDKSFKEVCDDLKTTKRLVMAIAAKMNVSVNDIKTELQDVIGGDR